LIDLEKLLFRYGPRARAWRPGVAKKLPLSDPGPLIDGLYQNLQ
jgi:hypothetical protein